ncbi:MAG: hypothetical protein N2C13_02940, partial [Chloroflexota bacterium]
GWTSNNSFIRTSRLFEQAPGNLEEINLLSGGILPLIGTHHLDANFDPHSKVLLVTIGSHKGSDPGIPHGVYIRFPGELRAHLLLQGDYWVKWYSPYKLFTAFNESGIYTIDTEGIVRQHIYDMRWTSVSPDGAFFITTNENGIDLYTSNGEFQKHLSDNRYPGEITWLPDSTGFYLAMEFLVAYFEQEGWQEKKFTPLEWYGEIYIVR